MFGQVHVFSFGMFYVYKFSKFYVYVYTTLATNEEYINTRALSHAQCFTSFHNTCHIANFSLKESLEREMPPSCVDQDNMYNYNIG